MDNLNRVEVRCSFITTTVQEESQVTPQFERRILPMSYSRSVDINEIHQFLEKTKLSVDAFFDSQISELVVRKNIDLSNSSASVPLDTKDSRLM